MSEAYLYVHGPVGLYIRIPKVGAGPKVGPTALSGLATFLGHCEKSPEPNYDQKWKPVFTSQSGEVIPADKIYLGTEVKIILPLARWDYDVTQALLAAPRHGRGSPPGTETYLDRGVLLQRNGVSFELWLRNEFAGTVNAAAYPDMPIGTYFPCCNLAAHYPKNLARDAGMLQLMIEANWVQGYPAGSSVCFTSDPAFFKQLPGIG